MFDEDDFMKKPPEDTEVFEFGQGKGGYSPPNNPTYESYQSRERDFEYMLLHRQLKILSDDVEGKFNTVKKKYKSNLTIAVVVMIILAFVMAAVTFVSIDYAKNYEELKAQLIKELENIHEYSYNVSGDAYETTIASKVYDQQINSVVMIECTDSATGGSGVAGTGIVLDIKDSYAYILTNCHVISYEFGVANRLTFYKYIIVKMDESSTSYNAKVVSYDEDKDLAVIRIQNTPSEMKKATFALSKSIKLGDYAIVIGNAAGLGISITTGIFSNVINNAEYLEGITLIQTSAAVNPGNSGGPLFNAQGYCAGIVTLKKTYDAEDPNTMGFEGLGFAVASDVAKEFIDSISTKDFKMYFVEA